MYERLVMENKSVHIVSTIQYYDRALNHDLDLVINIAAGIMEAEDKRKIS